LLAEIHAAGVVQPYLPRDAVSVQYLDFAASVHDFFVSAVLCVNSCLFLSVTLRVFLRGWSILLEVGFRNRDTPQIVSGTAPYALAARLPFTDRGSALCNRCSLRI